MATWTGNFVSISGGFGVRMRIETQLAGQNIAGNYSTINYQAYADFNGADAQLDGGWVQSSAGVHYNNGGRVYNYAGNFSNHTVTMNTGSFNIGHDNAGNGSYGMNAHVTAYGSGTTTASGSEGLPTIPRAATLTGLSMDGGGIAATDEGPYWVEFNNPAGSDVRVFMETLDGGVVRVYTSGANAGSRFNFTPSATALQNAIPNSNVGTLRIGIYDATFNAYDYRDRTYTIKNDTGQANPNFSTTAYHDSNSSTATLTGDNQKIVQNASTLNVDIASGNKATSRKGSSMVSYTASINGVPTNITYTTSTINQFLGAVDSATDQILAVTATDSRGNTTTVNKTVSMIPYSTPNITAVGSREDGFGEDTTIDINPTYSTITVGGVPKNSVNNATGVSYKVWAVGGTEPGSYTNVPSTYSGGTVTITSDPIETLDQSTEYNLKVKVTDGLYSVIYSTLIGIGKAAFRIGTDGFVYNENKKILAALDLFPVGSTQYTVVNTNPQSYLGGTWVAMATASATFFGETVYAWKRTV